MAETRERIEFEGSMLDEIYVAGGAHLESMGGNVVMEAMMIEEEKRSGE